MKADYIPLTDMKVKTDIDWRQFPYFIGASDSGILTMNIPDNLKLGEYGGLRIMIQAYLN